MKRVSKERPRRPRRETRTIGFRLPSNVAQSVKAEADRRGIMLNRLFEEMWELYQKHKSERA
jgi:hypothetical protein